MFIRNKSNTLLISRETWTPGRGKTIGLRVRGRIAVNYGDLTLGQIEEIVSKLGGLEAAKAFLRGDLVVAKKEKMSVVSAAPPNVATPPPVLFATPEEQIKQLLEISDVLWKDITITEKAIRDLGDPPRAPVSDRDGLYCVVLLSETGDALETFKRNWDACVYIHNPNTWKWDELLFTQKGVRARKDAKPAPIGLRWAVAELGRAFRGGKVSDVRRILDRQGRMGIGQELPLIGALHPNWVKAMNGSDIPYVNAPDLEVAPNAQDVFTCAPCLFFECDDHQVGLSAELVGDAVFDSGSGFLW